MISLDDLITLTDDGRLADNDFLLVKGVTEFWEATYNLTLEMDDDTFIRMFGYLAFRIVRDTLDGKGK